MEHGRMRGLQGSSAAATPKQKQTAGESNFPRRNERRSRNGTRKDPGPALRANIAIDDICRLLPFELPPYSCCLLVATCSECVSWRIETTLLRRVAHSSCRSPGKGPRASRVDSSRSTSSGWWCGSSWRRALLPESPSPAVARPRRSASLQHQPAGCCLRTRRGGERQTGQNGAGHTRAKAEEGDRASSSRLR